MGGGHGGCASLTRPTVMRLMLVLYGGGGALTRPAKLGV